MTFPRTILVLCLSGAIAYGCSAQETPSDSYSRLDSHAQYAVQNIVHAPALPEELDFAGERVPLERFDVFESLDREVSSNSFLHSNTILCVKRAARWFPVIEPILEANGIPDDFKYLAVIESNLTNVVSPAGAAGFWQFMKSTAIEKGLEVNTEVDERYNLEKATVAACKYLSEAKERYGSWTGAAASYNVGYAGYSRQIANQKVNDYYDLFLNEETSRYVFRILALKLIMQDPVHYGFDVPEDNLYREIPAKTIEVSGRVANWADFALQHGTTYKILRNLNPWIRAYTLTNASKKTYKVKIPE